MWKENFSDVLEARYDMAEGSYWGTDYKQATSGHTEKNNDWDNTQYIISHENISKHITNLSEITDIVTAAGSNRTVNFNKSTGDLTLLLCLTRLGRERRVRYDVSVLFCFH